MFSIKINGFITLDLSTRVGALQCGLEGSGAKNHSLEPRNTVSSGCGVVFFPFLDV